MWEIVFWHEAKITGSIFFIDDVTAGKSSGMESAAGKAWQKITGEETQSTVPDVRQTLTAKDFHVLKMTI